MDHVEAVVIIRTAQLVIQRRPGPGWNRDTQTEAELQAATDAMHAAWWRLKMNSRDAQLRRAVKHARN